ncbi:glycosyltransferase family 2 protein [Halobacillus litoralis]|uniref:glycosyltransferase n=1 Tax=Halobacillus litoralis TaxID=45668 RepID=UPI001CFE9026|nr:glycosyltransferase family 2 protein [Halobacillus litoralis]WLR47139.1 glycosyltransferase family 2 protein [Halobacillus litoralis]
MSLFFILLIMTIVLNVWTIYNSLFLYPLSAKREPEDQPFVSLLVPLRNEAGNVEGLIRSLRSLTYPDLEVILLDDHSEDGTLDKLNEQVADDERFSVIQGKELPEGWNGKVHACHQLSQAANGECYLFLDADARVAPGTIQQALAMMQQKKASMLSGFPNYPNNHFLSHMLVPLQHMVVLLHLPLFVANHTKKPMFTAACGIFIIIDRKAYEAIGGHASVKDSLVEDVHIAREVKKHGYKMILANITKSVLSYMYVSGKETWEGFKKNVYTGIGRSVGMVLFLTLFYAVVFLAPACFAIVGLVTGDFAFLLPYLLTVAFKMYVDARTGHPLWLSFLLPVAVVLLISIMMASMFVHKRGEKYQWKGRFYQ